MTKKSSRLMKINFLYNQFDMLLAYQKRVCLFVCFPGFWLKNMSLYHKDLAAEKILIFLVTDLKGNKI